MYSKRILVLTTIASIAFLSMLAGCGPGDGDEPEMTNVEPYETTTPAEPPEIDDAAADEPERTQAIDPREPVDSNMQPVDKELFASADIGPASGSSVSGELRFEQRDATVRITGTVTGLAPGEHGFHIHAEGDCSAPDAASAKGHFAPDGDPHGSPETPNNLNHVGDLGNITANADGVANVAKTDAEMTLGSGDKSIIGRAVIVHADADDLTSQPSGAAGARVGCGIIELDVSPAYTGS
jgi:superoxide dismutase, Cu-Zn family